MSSYLHKPQPAASWHGALPRGTLAVAATPSLAASAPPSKPGENPFYKFLISGGVTIVFEMACGHYLEFLKIAKQTSSDSYLQITKNMTGKKGLIGILDGFFPWGFLQCAFKGAAFGFGQAQSKVMLDNLHWFSNDTNTVLSGGLGGAIQGVVMSPLLLLKTRVMTDPSFRESGSMMQTAKASAQVGARVIKDEGVMALMKGVGVFSFKRFADWTTRYLFVVMTENILFKTQESQKLTLGQQTTAALVGGTLSALVTIPIDVMVATVQQANKAGQRVGIWETYKAQLQQGGMKGTFGFATRGLVARVAHVALTTLMMKTIASKVYDLLLR